MVQLQQQYYPGTGKRKSAIAQVRLLPSGGQVTINDRPLEEYFPWAAWQERALEPLKVTETLGKFGLVVKVAGGGISSQAGAVRHGVARALVAYDEQFKTTLRKHGLLTRDARIKESKKYGLKRARRAPQYTKR
ncbi:MAG: 30S ribosomal protein S9 [Dehalococcoidia bacterium]